MKYEDMDPRLRGFMPFIDKSIRSIQCSKSAFIKSTQPFSSWIFESNLFKNPVAYT